MEVLHSQGVNGFLGFSPGFHPFPGKKRTDVLKMTPEQEDKVRQKIELIRRKVRHIFDLLDEIEKELEKDDKPRASIVRSLEQFFQNTTKGNE